MKDVKNFRGDPDEIQHLTTLALNKKVQTASTFPELQRRRAITNAQTPNNPMPSHTTGTFDGTA